LNGHRSVLVVDRSEETRDVLQTVLERHGVRTLTTDRAATGAELVRQHHPDLVVLDLEIEDLTAEDYFDRPESSEFPQRLKQPQPPQLVLLGSMRRQGDRLPDGEFVAKPYHYGLLIRRIEELLDCCTRESGPCRRCLSSAEPIKEAASS
jgi:CheY-like chemotaxis protein